MLRAARADGLGKRADLSTLFTTQLVSKRGMHVDFDQLRVAPTGQPWSVWILFSEHAGEFAGWYVNLERPHIRDDRAVYTSDRVLDLVIQPDRTAVRKDEDELALAVEQGVFDAASAARSRPMQSRWRLWWRTGDPRSVTIGSGSHQTPAGPVSRLCPKEPDLRAARGARKRPASVAGHI